MALGVTQLVFTDNTPNMELGIIYTVICALIPFASLLFSRLFKMEKGKIKNISFAVTAIVILGLGVRQGVSNADTLKSMTMLRNILYFDTDDSIIYRSDIPDDVMTEWDYEDKHGNIYTSILSVCYDTNGSAYVGMGNEYKTR
ncbi:MAG: hypothetical protein NC213_04025 [Acetobacter sp.]|nr:hypothetical protein [Bacteroides sp.]MCM1340891.1 hypothetical protein [Acetobacter sp.]MCM1432552.1 hypothetical protein [Clostridiales bacterium]